jgi:hypothetical protein
MSASINPIVPKRNATAGADAPPPASALQLGEIAVNTASHSLYLKGEDGQAHDVAPVKSVAGKSGNVALDIADVAGGVSATLLAAPSGIATLDSGGKIPASQLPASVTGAMNFQGTWDAATNTPHLTSGTGIKGWLFKVSVAGATVIDGISQWNVGDSIVFNGTTWDKIDGIASEVLSVAGKTGAVSLNSGDLSDSGTTGRQLVAATSPAVAKAALSIGVTDVAGAAPVSNPSFTGVTNAQTIAASVGVTVNGQPVLVDGQVLSGGTY